MRNKILTLGPILLFLMWSSAFIYRSSFIAIDGQRYFCLFDDAMISMRYALNLAQGAGLVWNKGEYVEGYTNFLQVLIMSGWQLISSSRVAPLMMQLSAMVILILCALLARAVFRKISIVSANHFSSALVIALILFYFPLTFWTLSGMEVGLVALCYLLIARNIINNQATNRLGLITSALYLLRPDTILPILATFLVLFTEKKVCRKSLAREGLVCFFVIIAHLLFRLSYYQQLLPNTYILKVSGVALSVRLQTGFSYLLNWGMTHLILILLATYSVIKRRNLLTFWFISLLLVNCFTSLLVGGDAFLHWRFLCMVSPLLIIYALDGAYSLKAKVYRMPLICIGLVCATSQGWSELLLLEKHMHQALYQNQINQALALKHIAKPSATTVVFFAGTLPYYAGLPAIDALGKSDAYIAKLPARIHFNQNDRGSDFLPGHVKYELDYSIKQKLPTFVETFVWRDEDITAWAKNYYASYYYKGIRLSLLKDSDAIDYSKLQITASP